MGLLSHAFSSYRDPLGVLEQIYHKGNIYYLRVSTTFFFFSTEENMFMSLKGAIKSLI